MAESMLTPRGCWNERNRPLLEERARLYDVKTGAAYISYSIIDYGSSCFSMGVAALRLLSGHWVVARGGKRRV